MTLRTHALEAELATIPGALVAARTVVALPPSDLDPADDEMRVYVNGVLVIREYDPELEQP
jgi:hypothetical protein